MQRRQLRTRLRKAGKETGHCLKNVAWQTSKCALWTICAPCLCCALLCLPRRRRCNHEQVLEIVTPELPTPRPRALSLPLIEAQPVQRTSDQPQSDFMSKLPLELRRMIYLHALGGVAMHMTTLGGKPYARQCNREECHCDLFDPTNEKALSFSPALLRTCRLIYSEAIEYLYATNTFSLSTDCDQVPTLDYLSYYFLPQRIVQIQDLRIHWQLDGIPYYLTALSPAESTIPGLYLGPWRRSWDALSRLTGLRRLRIDLSYRYSLWSDFYEKIWTENPEEWLQPIKSITAPRHFVVTLPDRKCRTDIDIKPSHCILKLPEGEYASAV